MDVQLAPVALGERREGGFFTRDRGADALVSSIDRHTSIDLQVTLSAVPVMSPIPFA
jgi:hypothetical protein